MNDGSAWRDMEAWAARIIKMMRDLEGDNAKLRQQIWKLEDEIELLIEIKLGKATDKQQNDDQTDL